LTSLKRGLSVEDQALVDRLSKLKTEIKDVKQTPSQQEIEDRLAKLKGISPDVYRKPAVFTTYSNSNVDPVTQLLNQVTEETAIDSQSDHPVEMDQTPSHDEDEVELLLKKACAAAEMEAKMEIENLKTDKEIERRMNDLKIERKKATEKESISDDSDEEQQASKIVEKALAENRLELDDDFSTDLKMEDELPWCELCNEDAQLRCTECDGDLYCRRCWKETHNDAELKQHHTKNYKPPK